MATIQNQGTVFYTSNGSTEVSLTSNTTFTEINVAYELDISHAASPTSYVLGDTIRYTTVLRNIGTGTYYDPIVSVDLGNGTLSYVSGSAVAYLNNGGELVPLTVNVTPREASAVGVTFSFGNALLPRDAEIILVYDATVESLGDGSITSVATGSAAQGSPDGAVDTVTDSAVITASPLTLEKTAPTVANVGDTISYVFNLTNNTASPIEINGLSDQLPAGFTFVGVALEVEGVAVPIEAGDYSVIDNLFTYAPITPPVLGAGDLAQLTITGVVTA